ncbi:MAG: helix-turn-helix domain-containing protein [Bacteroidota bacterium]
MKKPTIKENLLYHRKRMGYTQDELAERTTVGLRTIQRIEKGDVQPHLQTVKLLAVGLEVEVDDLIVLDDPKEEPISRKWMLLLHATPFFGFMIPLANVLFPLFVWMNKADDHKKYDQHGRAVINFHSTMSLLFVLSLALYFVIPGYNYFITGAIVLIGVFFSLRNTLSSIKSGAYYYPFSISFLKNKR